MKAVQATPRSAGTRGAKPPKQAVGGALVGQVACHSRFMCTRCVLNQYTNHALMIVIEYDAQSRHNLPADRPTHNDSTRTNTRTNTHHTSSQCVSRVTKARFEHAQGAVRPPACERAAARLLVRQQRVGGRWRRVDGRGGRHAGQHVLRGSLCPWAVAWSGVWSVTVACAARSRSAGQLADESTPAGLQLLQSACARGVQRG
jgi:hypothetical protein